MVRNFADGLYFKRLSERLRIFVGDVGHRISNEQTRLNKYSATACCVYATVLEQF